jgi:hypothetical protein
MGTLNFLTSKARADIKIQFLLVQASRNTTLDGIYPMDLGF